jgi:hypothetical protein
MKTFALVYGIVFIVVGLAGFVPGLTVAHEHPDVAVTGGLGLLFGLFPVNWVHNLIHIAFGAWGLAASRSLGATRSYARSVAIIYVVLAVLGFISIGNLYTVFGLAPLYGHDIWLHLLLAGGAGYFGYMHRDAKYMAA